MPQLTLDHPYRPQGDQPKAIAQLVQGLRDGMQDQVLLGVTGSGKTFTVANVIQAYQKPTLIVAPNKTLAAQLYFEMKEFFPHNAVEYFVSYYDYYQPEAYVPKTDTYIEKESSINENIDRLRHSATRSLLERKDVIIVASVSCIYGIGAVESYGSMVVTVSTGCSFDRDDFLKQLVALHYTRSPMSIARGMFRVRGDAIELFPSHYEERLWRIETWQDNVEAIWEVNDLGQKIQQLERIKLYANSHYVTPGPTMAQAIECIQQDLKERLLELEQENKLVESQRLQQRVTFDLEMMKTTGYCNGIENYSRYLTGRQPGQPPPTLFDYLTRDSLLIVDESHMTVPQIRAMYNGDAARKKTLSDYGFRLPACKDNRPLTFQEWSLQRPPTLYVSATPGAWEVNQAKKHVEQVIRPTGIVDPLCFVRPTHNQVDDLIQSCKIVIADGQRSLVTTLTKKMAEALTTYLTDAGLKVCYLHSDIPTLERTQRLEDLRTGLFDVLVGINLLREGLDIPQCALVAILDADKAGFLRSATSLIQTIGRAARNMNGHVVLYADTTTPAMKQALEETKRRRQRQTAFNKKHNIHPQQIQKAAHGTFLSFRKNTPKKKAAQKKARDSTCSTRDLLEQRMYQAAGNLEFEKAAALRDQLKIIEKNKK